MRIDLGSLGWSGRVLPPAAAEAGGGGEGRGERRGRREERTAVAGRRACAPRSPTMRLAFGQSSRTMLRPCGQRNGPDRASPPSAWVSTAAGGKSPGNRGDGEARAVAETAAATAALGPSY